MASLWRTSGPEHATARQLLRVAWPLILTNSFWTLQILLDRIFLSWQDSDSASASMTGALLFWVPMALLQNTSGYAGTFVAQYTGAGRPERVGAAVWQALHFSLLAGLAFLLLVPVAGGLVALGGHSPKLQQLETVYFRCLCVTGLPTLVIAAVSSFFSGRGDSWTVLLINAAGLLVNGVLCYCWIFGIGLFPAWGIAGAGWATVAGMYTSAVLGLVLMLRKCYRTGYATGSAWRLDRELFRRLMRFGLPSGVFMALDCLGFTLFTLLIGKLGEVELAATTIAWTLNLLVFLPAMGLAQAVAVLVGQRLGEDRPEAAAQVAWTGLRMGLVFTGVVGAIYLLVPGALAYLFRGGENLPRWEEISVLVPVLLRFVVVYCLFDTMNLVFSYALRGAGDTRFVTAVALTLSWPVMVVPTWAAWYFGWGLYWAWTFASVYIMLLAVLFLYRFRQGKWRTMRVIESQPLLPRPRLEERSGKGARVPFSRDPQGSAEAPRSPAGRG